MRSRTPYILGTITAVLAVISSVVPLVFDLYARDPAFAKGAQLGTDLVTLFLATPLLVVAMVLAARGSTRARLVWIGMLEYMVYNFLYYLLGAQMNALLPAYVALCALPLYALIMLMNKTDMTALGTAFAASAPARRVAGWMVLFALLLAVMWLVQWYLTVFTGWRNDGLPAEAIHLIAAVDLTVFCPAFLIIATLLWRREPLGLAHAAAAMVMASVYPIVLIASAPFQAGLGVADAWTAVPLWAALSLGSLVSAVALLSRLGRPGA
jgi:hypothetical protein